MHAYRASVLRFDALHQPVFDTDGLLVVDRGADGRQVVVDVGDHAALKTRYAEVPTIDWRGRIVAPGFVDMHVHYPQTDVIGAPADGLLPWLENYTFPHEARFHDPVYARGVAEFFFDELQRHGVTTALTFSTSHPASVDAVFSSHNIEHLYPHEVPLALKEFMRVLKPDGFVLMTCPDL